jgi:serine phosphatase RsbU (regulator of sigma subunit)
MSTENVSHTAPAWPDARQFRSSLRWQLPLYVLLMIVSLMSATGYLITRQYVSEVTSHVVDRLMIQARSHAASAAKDILSPNGPDVLLLNSICRELATANPELYWAGIADNKRVLLAHTDVRRLAAGDRLALPDETVSGVIRSGSARTYVVRDTLYVYMPVRERDMTVGHLALAFPTTQMREARMRSIMTVGSVTLLAVLFGTPLILWLVGRKLRPIGTIVKHLRKVDPADLSFEIPVPGRNEFAYLAETLKVMGGHLKRAQEERNQAERMHHELEIAREIQTGILPRKYPCGPTFEFHGAYVSANEVGGDYYDFLPFDNDRLGFLIADVSGKSLPGMLVMLMTRDIIRGMADGDQDPRSLLCKVNRELLTSIRKGMFVTMLYGLMDQRSGEVTIASAGHNPLIWLSSATGTTSQIRPPGYPLGLLEPNVFDQRIKNESLHLGAGDWLVQYTDGVNEARSPLGAEYGMDRLLKSLLERRRLTAVELVESALKEHASFVGSAAQHDDITLVALKWHGLEYEPMTKGAASHVASC